MIVPQMVFHYEGTLGVRSQFSLDLDNTKAILAMYRVDLIVFHHALAILTTITSHVFAVYD